MSKTFVVESIADHRHVPAGGRRKGTSLEYLICWSGYPGEDTWETATHVYAVDCIKAYWERWATQRGLTGAEAKHAIAAERRNAAKKVYTANAPETVRAEPVSPAVDDDEASTPAAAASTDTSVAGADGYIDINALLESENKSAAADRRNRRAREAAAEAAEVAELIQRAGNGKDEAEAAVTDEEAAHTTAEDVGADALADVDDEGDGEDAYEVASIEGRRDIVDANTNRARVEYKVRWGGRWNDPRFDSWEPRSNLHCHQLIKEYEKRRHSAIKDAQQIASARKKRRTDVDERAGDEESKAPASSNERSAKQSRRLPIVRSDISDSKTAADDNTDTSMSDDAAKSLLLIGDSALSFAFALDCLKQLRVPSPSDDMSWWYHVGDNFTDVVAVPDDKESALYASLEAEQMYARNFVTAKTGVETRNIALSFPARSFECIAVFINNAAVDDVTLCTLLPKFFNSARKCIRPDGQIRMSLSRMIAERDKLDAACATSSLQIVCVLSLVANQIAPMWKTSQENQERLFIFSKANTYVLKTQSQHKS